jgi:hypothetical protein
MVTIFMVNEDIARGMVCFFHQKKHSYLIVVLYMKNPPIAQVKKLPKGSPNAFLSKQTNVSLFSKKSSPAQEFIIVLLYLRNPPIAQEGKKSPNLVTLITE